MRTLLTEKITAELLRGVLDYDHDTGIFTWRQRSQARPCDNAKLANIGVAGHLSKRGYCEIGIYGRTYRAHQLAWLYMTGEWPTKIDHKDTNKANNRWLNLRLATQAQNGQNRTKSKRNTSGKKGVWLHRKTGKWSATIVANGCRQYLGLFGTVDEAHAAYVSAAEQLHGEYARP